MRMMKTLWPLGAAALALGLSGCGGGSSAKPAPERTAAAPVVEPPVVESVLLSGANAESIATALGVVMIGGDDGTTSSPTSATQP